MTKNILTSTTYFIILLAFQATCLAQSYNSLIAKGVSFYQAKDYANSVQAYQMAFKIQKDNPVDLYNSACSAALCGQNELAMNLLNVSVNKGWTNLDHLITDQDLNSLHGLKEWNMLVSKLKSKNERIEATYNRPLQKELLDILESDQVVRLSIMKLIKTYGMKSYQVDSVNKLIMHTDSINLIKVVKILNQYGWVGKDLVGDDASAALFLVIQHSDLPIQQKYLPKMREAVKKGNARSYDLALLEDRVAIRERRKQIYGSQVRGDNETGKFYLEPLIDPYNVDKRREEVGLGPIAEYVSEYGIIWNPADYK